MCSYFCILLFLSQLQCALGNIYIYTSIYAIVIKIDAYSRVIELFPETRYTTLITVFFLPLSFLIAQ